MSYTLQYHIKRLANNVDYRNITECGWELNGDIHWADEIFPDQVQNILFEKKYSDSDGDYCGSVKCEDDLNEYL